MKTQYKVSLGIALVLVCITVLIVVFVRQSLTSFVDEQNAKNVTTTINQ